MADDGLLKLLMDTKVIELASTLVAKLEHIRYDETRKGVFRTQWGCDLFTTAVKRLCPDSLSNFDIDEWFMSVVTMYPSKQNRKFEINPAKFLQDVETNWLAPLLIMEQKAPGFIVLLHNMMDLEDKTHCKIAETAKREDQYDFLGVGPRNKATSLFLTGTSSQTHMLTQK